VVGASHIHDIRGHWSRERLEVLMLNSEGKKYKSIFVSDVHLGTRGCQSEALNSFLKENSCDRLYLVGDIIDGWRLRKRTYWPQSHSNLIRRILTIAKDGNRVYYIVGNHDEVLRKWLNFDLRFGRIKITNSQDYVAINGKKYLVIHGDQFDGLMREKFKWVMHLGDVAYNALVWFNIKFNTVRRILGMEYWSLSKYLKHNAKKAMHYVDNFEENLAAYARKRGYDGVICGHIHTAAMRNIGDIEYINCGDWVESLTAIVENWDGTFELIDCSQLINKKKEKLRAHENTHSN
jgi:UDP-2,3-diacylglucosamine pyrophosphatase LpxH